LILKKFACWFFSNNQIQIINPNFNKFQIVSTNYFSVRLVPIKKFENKKIENLNFNFKLKKEFIEIKRIEFSTIYYEKMFKPEGL